ncbi:MAG TPA: hypothetical protein VIR58_04870, partial [Acidimicrobiales bacterium]
EESAAQAAPIAAASPSGAAPTRDELSGAWDAVLQALKPGTRAVFGTGRFADSTADAAVFALQNAPTRDHCDKKRPEVEAALTAHFGRPVSLRLVTESDVGGGEEASGPAPSSGAAAPAGPQHEDEDSIDVSELEDAPDVSTGVERLAQAFPGAELVDEP